MEQQKVPELRFPEFQDEWKTQKLGELIVEYNEYADMGSEYPLLTSSRSGLMLQSQFRDSKTTKNEEALFSVLPYGYCTYRHMSDDDVFHFNINNLVSNGLVSKEYPVFSTKNDNDLYAIVCNLNHSRKFRSFCRAQKMGGTRTRLYFNKLCQYKILFPSQKEQDKISNFFITLDNRIDLADKKLATLQTIKQGMLQKIFSQELRFKDDEGKEFPAWKTSPLNKLLDFIRNGFVGTILPYYTDAQHGVRYLQGTNIHDGKIDDTVEYYVTQDFNQAHAKNILKSDDILVVQSGHVGDCVVVGDKYVGCNCHALIIMSNGGQCSSEYICYYLHSPKGRKSLKLLEKGNTVKHILATDIAKMNVLVPSLPEQQKIAAYFTALDRAIAAAQQKAAALRTIKRGLLQKMFV